MKNQNQAILNYKNLKSEILNSPELMLTTVAVGKKLHSRSLSKLGMFGLKKLIKILKRRSNE